MSRFSLAPYAVRVRETGSRKREKFGNIKGKNFLETLESLLDSLRSTKLLKDSIRTLSLDELHRDGSQLSGIVRSGECGIDADFVDTETMLTHKKMRRQKHSEVYPFFFLFDLPANEDYGYAILQEYRGRGIKSVLHVLLAELLKPMNLVISVKPIFSPKLFEQLERSRLVKLRFIRRIFPKDIADLVHVDKPEEIVEERVIRAMPGGRLWITEGFKRLLGGALSDKSEGYYTIQNEEYHTVKAETRTGDDTKTLTFGSTPKLRESMPLKRNLILKGGFPTYNYLLGRAKRYLSDIVAEAR